MTKCKQFLIVFFSILHIFTMTFFRYFIALAVALYFLKRIFAYFSELAEFTRPMDHVYPVFITLAIKYTYQWITFVFKKFYFFFSFRFFENSSFANSIWIQITKNKFVPKQRSWILICFHRSFQSNFCKMCFWFACSMLKSSHYSVAVMPSACFYLQDFNCFCLKYRRRYELIGNSVHNTCTS